MHRQGQDKGNQQTDAVLAAQHWGTERESVKSTKYLRPNQANIGTDAAALTPAYGGPPTVILGPGEMKLAHQTDEYCRVDRLEQSVELYVEIARRWCGL